MPESSSDDYVSGAGTAEDARKQVMEHLEVRTAKDDARSIRSRDSILETEGHKDDQGKPPFFYLPWSALEEVAYVMEYGAQKYAPGNYQKGMLASRLFSAAIRHWVAWWWGEENDPETGKSHLAHAACCVLMLIESTKMGTVRDDRYVR